jgi:hypothetical protein
MSPYNSSKQTPKNIDARQLFIDDVIGRIHSTACEYKILRKSLKEHKHFHLVLLFCFEMSK